MKPMTSDSRPSWQPLALSLVLLTLPIAILIRLIPYEQRMPNFALAGALFLFAGARLRSWPGLILPFLAMAAVDLYLLGVKDWHPSPWSYASYAVYLLLARWQLAQTKSPVWIGTITLFGSIQFFLISNFGVWVGCVQNPSLYAGSDFFYPATFEGLMKCYRMGLPFFRGTLFSDVLFSGLLFGAYALLSRAYFPQEQVERIVVRE